VDGVESKVEEKQIEEQAQQEPEKGKVASQTELPSDLTDP
jgi:hypothetical protein